MSFIALTLMSAVITVAPAGIHQPGQAVVKYGDLNLSTVDAKKFSINAWTARSGSSAVLSGANRFICEWPSASVSEQLLSSSHPNVTLLSQNLA